MILDSQEQNGGGADQNGREKSKRCNLTHS
jgi:hypothetical protein